MDSEVAIVGAGPMGLAAAAELKRRGIPLLHFDKGCIAKTTDWFPSGMRFYSSAKELEIADFPIASSGEKPTREEYLAYARAFVRFHDLKVRTYEAVEAIEGKVGNFLIRTRKRGGEQYRYRVGRVVLALGGVEEPRRLGVSGEDLPHVSHYFVDAHKYFGQRVVIVGARNSAADTAINLTHHDAQVTLVHRRPEISTRGLKYWIHPEFTGMIRRGRIRAQLDSVITSIDAGGVDYRTSAGAEGRIECDFVLLLIGYVPDFTLIDQLGLRTEGDQREPVVDESTYQTTRVGVYACGTMVAGAQNPYRIFLGNARHHPRLIAEAIAAERSKG